MTESDKDIRWKQRFSNFKKAYAQLCDFPELEVLNKYEVQGLIQSFEYTFELAWKTLQDLLKEKGFQNAIGPRPVIEQSFQSGFIQDGEGWMEMLKMRNEANHTYQEEVVERISAAISAEFLEYFRVFQLKLEEEANL